MKWDIFHEARMICHLGDLSLWTTFVVWSHHRIHAVATHHTIPQNKAPKHHIKERLETSQG